MIYLLIILALLVIWIVWTTVGRSRQRTVVFEYERGLRYSNGKFQQVLEPGSYSYWTYSETIYKVDMRTRFVSIPGQEVLSADSVGIRISLAAQYTVADPLQATHASTSYEQALYLELQLALREIVGNYKIDELLAARQQIGEQLLARAEEPLRALGLQLTSVSVKDIMFPGELKKIFAQVVKAQKEGQAALERARGESAALRNLANAAKMVENNPALMQLRLLQAVGESSGNTVVLGLSAQATPLPIGNGPRDRATAEIPDTDHASE